MKIEMTLNFNTTNPQFEKKKHIYMINRGTYKVYVWKPPLWYIYKKQMFSPFTCTLHLIKTLLEAPFIHFR